METMMYTFRENRAFQATFGLNITTLYNRARPTESSVNNSS